MMHIYMIDLPRTRRYGITEKERLENLRIPVPPWLRDQWLVGASALRCGAVGQDPGHFRIDSLIHPAILLRHRRRRQDALGVGLQLLRGAQHHGVVLTDGVEPLPDFRSRLLQDADCAG